MMLDPEFQKWMIGLLPVGTVLKLRRLYDSKQKWDKVDDATRLLIDAVEAIMGIGTDVFIGINPTDGPSEEDFRKYLDEHGIEGLIN